MQIITLDQIAEQLNCTSRHASRLAQEEEWQRVDGGYELLSVAVYYPQIKTPFAPAPVVQDTLPAPKATVGADLCVSPRLGCSLAPTGERAGVRGI